MTAEALRYEPTRGLALWGDAEVAAGTEVLRSRSLFRYYGPQQPQRTAAFEAAFAEAMGVRHAVAVSSGTAALACALVGLGMPAGAEVVLPAVTFVACVNSVVWARGVPVLADVDDTLTLDPASLESCISERTWAVMPVHLANVVADMDPIMAVARRHGIRVLEDAAQAAGARYRGRRAGSIGDAGAFSFQLEKNITAGEGGAVVTDDDDVHQRVLRYQDQGGQFTTSRGEVRGAGVEPFTGVNLRMTEVAAAVLSVQLGRLDPMLARMREIAQHVKAQVADLPLHWRHIPDEDGCGGDLTLLLDDRMSARRFLTAVLADRIPARTMYQGQAVYAAPAVREGRTAWGVEWPRPERRVASEQAVGRSVTIDLGAAMTADDVAAVVAAIRGAHASLRQPALAAPGQVS